MHDAVMILIVTERSLYERTCMCLSSVCVVVCCLDLRLRNLDEEEDEAQ